MTSIDVPLFWLQSFFSFFLGLDGSIPFRICSDASNPIEHFYLLFKSYAVSDSDVGNGLGPVIWFWFRPLTVGYTIFFGLLYLMRRQDMARYTYIVITSLLILTLSQVHFPELLYSSYILLFLALFFPTIKLRIKRLSLQ